MDAPRTVCGATYRSKYSGVQHCTKPAEHRHMPKGDVQTRHSWEWLREEDEASEVRTAAEVLIENINNGEADPYLDALLAALHGRKRAIRGVQNPYGVRAAASTLER